MKLPSCALLGFLLASLAAIATAACAASYNEAIFGDLSNDPEAPTLNELFHGNSVITGSVGGGDFDFVTLRVPAYHRVDSVVLNSYSGPSQSFAGLQNGGAWTAGTGGAINPANLLGWTHFGPAATGAGVAQDILDDLATPKNGSTGFTRPLGPGLYALLLQDTGAAVNYAIRFNVTYDLRPVGDFNGDFLINRFDLAKWREDFGVSAGSDANGDADSDGEDFLIWQRNLNRTSFATAIPEPPPAALAIAAAFALLGRRRVKSSHAAPEPSPGSARSDGHRCK